MSATSVFNTDSFSENLSTLNTAIRQSYSHAKKQLQDGMSVVKDEFIGICDKAEAYFNIIAMPVNNFLKDHTQIESELVHELNKDCMPFSTPRYSGNVIPIEQALNGCMEENY